MNGTTLRSRKLFGNAKRLLQPFALTTGDALHWIRLVSQQDNISNTCLGYSIPSSEDAPHLPNGDMQISVLTLEALKIPVPNIKVESEVISLVNKRTSDVHKLENEELDGKIDRLVYEMYNLNEEERRFIDSNISHT